MHKKISSLTVTILAITSLNTPAHETIAEPQHYITDDVYLPVRSTPNAQSKNNILTNLQSNVEVEIVNDMGRWSKIRYANNEEGYIPSRYIKSESTTKARLKRLQDAYQSLHKKNAKLQKIVTSTKVILIEQNKLLFGGLDHDKK